MMPEKAYILKRKADENGKDLKKPVQETCTKVAQVCNDKL
jgi:hypothetical protein